jgi:GDP-4-dehydro-6-deoxy-D-mannose reductase
MRVLITGMSGFAGSCLCDLLLRETPWTLLGISRNTDGARAHPRIFWWKFDLSDADAVTRFMSYERPDIIVHLAGQAHVPYSWEHPWETFETNVRGQLNLIEGVLKAKIAPRIVVATSNEIYGPPTSPADLPFKESRAPRPTNPYAVSKVAADAMALQYRLSHNLDIVIARPFNHTGPGQAVRFVAPSFAKQIAEIECGKREPVMHVGNMSAQRDFTDVRDIARAYLALIQRGEAGEVYNICSGTPRAIQTIFDGMLKLTTANIRLESDPSKFRVADTPISYGSNEKIKQHTGWQPQIPFEQTIKDILDEWRAKVQTEKQ